MKKKMKMMMMKENVATVGMKMMKVRGGLQDHEVVDVVSSLWGW